MATLHNLWNISGSIGNHVFYNMNGKQYVRQKPRKRTKKFKSSPAYDRVRKNMLEFGKAIRGAVLLRNALGITTDEGVDSQYFGKLSGRLMNVLKADSINPHGARSIMDGNLQLLRGYTPYKSNALQQCFGWPFGCKVDRLLNEVTVDIWRFDPCRLTGKSFSADSFKLTSICIEADFETGTLYKTETSTPQILVSRRKISGLELKHTLLSDRNKAIIVALRLDLFSDSPNPLPRYRSLQILAAEKPE